MVLVDQNSGLVRTSLDALYPVSWPGERFTFADKAGTHLHTVIRVDRDAVYWRCDR